MTEETYGNPIKLKAHFDYEKGEAVISSAFKKQVIAEPNIAMMDFLSDMIGELGLLYGGCHNERQRIIRQMHANKRDKS